MMFTILCYDDNWNGMAAAAQRHASHLLTATNCLHGSNFKFERSFCPAPVLKLIENTSSLHISLNVRRSLNKFPDFFVWALLLIVNTWNSSPLRSNLLLLQCTCCTVPTTSGRPRESPLVWACQWPSSQPLSSTQLSHTDSLWA